MEVLIQLIQVIPLYCGLQGSGMSTELRAYADQNPPRYSGNEIVASASCFRKVWHCSHDTKYSNRVNAANDCIDKHVNGELR